MPHTVVPVRTYVLVALALLALAGATYGIAFIDLGVWNTAVALAIAVTKAVLVVLIFMHVRYKGGLSRVVILAGLFWLALLMTFTLTDLYTRQWLPSPYSWSSSTSR